ncbi:MAG: glutamine--fructose-6-phosphate transaminase (isomerizing) ['Candidatus Kapabacteria' thiocyanatum]|uniref:Glutamine--fructose-6-phosphate aminotransferase [isomerizing] n=1 Tax=Candidatus Kapaibacterium thiocyanatum TaxID=1895771 RepID=A0A1M3L1Y1_9BACT|nr:glutamine--fructose-6-phosphate transaminase (isomerizing) ['Candidatus Kapabacteria' thiocyanatum]OJX59220.1 MAG: glutamine--fructose-6-phosphate aminotransferase ['Candidatus Kapabacteria' thiocyanatum]
MCGIVGYIGQQQAAPLIVNGLKRLEYRGYDSAGVCIVSSDGLTIGKKAGKVSELEKAFLPDTIPGMVGVGHTRWATHGAPNDINAHPHTDRDGAIALVHNGIIENYVTIRKKLVSAGYDTFRSETDSEVLAFFIGMLYETLGDLELSVRTALSEVEGTFGLVVVSSHEPGTIIAARRGSPLVLGVGDGEYLVASDAAAIVAHTRQVVYLHDNEMAILKRDGYITKTIENEVTESVVERIDIDLADIEKGGFPHFMLKEIYEQPDTFHDGFRGRLQIQDGNVRLGGLAAVTDKLRNARRIIITACGTSWHAGLVGEYLIEQMARVPVEVEYASEFRYRNPIIGPDDVVIAISQSGETADTLAAIREAKMKGATVLGMVNVVSSTIARETDAGVYLHAGPEIGVASTKAFTSQLCILTQFALYLARMRSMSAVEGRAIAEAMTAIPDQIRQILDQADIIRDIAIQYSGVSNFIYLGRGYNFPVALEGALKLKEISYIHAEGYAAAEMKHGPIALIDENMPVVFIAPKDEIYDKLISNIEVVRARNGRVISIANPNDSHIASVSNHVIEIPETLPMLTPILASIPLQLLAYYIAVERGCNVDMPRNLAKSVTVE